MFEKILSRIGVSLNKHNLLHMVVGGQAVLLYGKPRLTKDIEDVRTVLLKNPDVDIQYIRGWLKEFDESSDEREFLKTFDGIITEL